MSSDLRASCEMMLSRYTSRYFPNIAGVDASEDTGMVHNVGVIRCRE